MTTPRDTRAPTDEKLANPLAGKIMIRGAREHNLRDINLDLPKGKLVVFTGVSGSGKSSLAVDTLYAEGNRRYVESLSAYARQFLGQMERPHYDTIRGLSPAIAIQQKAPTRNPRSTVGTITEVYDYLRLLYARLGEQHCPECGLAIRAFTPEQMVRHIADLENGTRFLLLAPLSRGGPEEVNRGMREARRLGLVRVRLDGDVHLLDENPSPGAGEHQILEGVVDRLVAKDGLEDRLTDSVETALKLGGGTIVLSVFDGEDTVLSEHLVCPGCDARFPTLTPASFSFNSPHGACPTCTGLGRVPKPDPERLVPDPSLSIADQAVALSKSKADGPGNKGFHKNLLAFARKHRIDADRPWADLKPGQRRRLLEGQGNGEDGAAFEGIVPWLVRRHRTTRSDAIRRFLSGFFRETTCPDCGGSRLREESRNVLIRRKSLVEATSWTIDEARPFFEALRFEGADAAVAEEILREVRVRLRFLQDVGVGYLTLERRGNTLSGGESQRIRLASQLGSELTGVLYILDEPSIGLHARDVNRLLGTLHAMRDMGNTVLVVEHDGETIRSADHVIDFGPGAGVRGGTVVFEGRPRDLEGCEDSLTGGYLSGRLVIPRPVRRRRARKGHLELKGVTHNNVANLDVRLPLGVFTCVTGVSGAGKSTVVNQVLAPALARQLGRKSGPEPGSFKSLSGEDRIDKIVAVDQRPIGRSPRSNPVIYTRAFGAVREVFAELKESKMFGYGSSRFSFNVKGGRCETCKGDGIKRIEMHFLPDVYVPCEACGGRRFNEATCKVRFRGLSIADVLDLTVDEALEVFANMPRIDRPLQALQKVGLGYVKLGQPSNTLSGGESQRIKLARELARPGSGKTLYVLDEPTTGLHFEDIRRLLDVLDLLVEQGNTVLVIEHNLEVIKCADWVIDMGPEGGEAGGRIVAAGPPEKIATAARSHTGRFLKPYLAE